MDHRRYSWVKLTPIPIPSPGGGCTKQFFWKLGSIFFLTESLDCFFSQKKIDPIFQAKPQGVKFRTEPCHCNGSTDAVNPYLVLRITQTDSQTYCVTWPIRYRFDIGHRRCFTMKQSLNSACQWSDARMNRGEFNLMNKLCTCTTVPPTCLRTRTPRSVHSSGDARSKQKGLSRCHMKSLIVDLLTWSRHGCEFRLTNHSATITPRSHFIDLSAHWQWTTSSALRREKFLGYTLPVRNLLTISCQHWRTNLGMLMPPVLKLSDLPLEILIAILEESGWREVLRLRKVRFKSSMWHVSGVFTQDSPELHGALRSFESSEHLVEPLSRLPHFICYSSPDFAPRTPCLDVQLSRIGVPLLALTGSRNWVEKRK